MKFELLQLELKENSYGKNDIIVKKVKITDDNGVHLRFAKLNESLLDALLEQGGTLKPKE